ncbi:hypothetical protein HY970_00920 [Candidatus Kaiserbacteria bacterium]|nr:hypothetical protein [Candidatus Kaiserbacteria bacterium]
MDRFAHVILRIGVAFAFLYPPIDGIFHPETWIGYFPSFVHGILPDAVLLHGFGIFEILIALWILTGKQIALPSFAATGMLVAIVVFNHNQFEILFRDLTIAASTLALALDAYRREGLTPSRG